MEKDIPLDTTPPNPGPPSDPSELAAEPDPQPVSSPVTELVPQQYSQPAPKMDSQVHLMIPENSQQHPQQSPQPALPQYPQSAPLSVQQTPQQFSQPIIQPVNQMVVVQQMPTDCPGQMLCPHCNTTVVTKIEHKPGLLAWLICGTLGFLGCWPCCIIPFFVDACKDVEHSCPSCNKVLHIYKRR